jgi:hypothetical protein
LSYFVISHSICIATPQLKRSKLFAINFLVACNNICISLQYGKQKEARKSILLLMFAFQNFLELLTTTPPTVTFFAFGEKIEALNEVIGTIILWRAAAP